MNDELERIWDELLARGVHEQTLEVVTNINGYNEEALMDVADVLFGIKDKSDLIETEDDEEE